ncbi:cupin domain-containing protein [Sphingomonas lutea]|uniref:Cupin domain-containing protein n=1 Tax=Sphingomonas lutea TaxID=1045317 RepID=A0A7G9SJE6_9SPHN|nr:cupin domain-containing protein [Sphingomonas lutea]QNN67971.1 cupin domain-containing protein [Sphingomonas lutea]
MKKALLLGITTLLISSAAPAQMNADQLEWGPPPAGLPDGALFAVLAGNPEQPGPFVIRLRFPPGYKILPHRHSGDEQITVLSGEVSLGRGRSYSERKATKLTRGGFSPEPPNTDHYAFTKEGVEIQIAGQGPFTIAYVRARDDPRRKR